MSVQWSATRHQYLMKTWAAGSHGYFDLAPRDTATASRWLRHWCIGPFVLSGPTSAVRGLGQSILIFMLLSFQFPLDRLWHIHTYIHATTCFRPLYNDKLLLIWFILDIIFNRSFHFHPPFVDIISKLSRIQ